MLMVFRGVQAGPTAKGDGTFEGDVWRDAIFSQDGVTAGSNFFAPCGRTYWHTHEGGQLLIIVAGSGFVVDDDGANRVEAGDMVWTPPGVRHWHGGCSDRFLIHTTVSVGGTEWHAPVSDAEFAEAESTPLVPGASVDTD